MTCYTCGEELPAGRKARRCTPCQRAYQAEYRARRMPGALKAHARSAARARAALAVAKRHPDEFAGEFAAQLEAG